jgi:hypothetical protein
MLLLAGLSLSVSAQPVRLHPDNPHYLEYDGEPLVLVSSAEHYGAVINADFDYARYLETLHRDGLNYTRIFTGSYIENPESTFGIERNTLAPVSPDRFVSPWIRSETSGALDGGNKFDLDTWNPAYFERLRSFVGLARELDVIVEATLFSSIYQDSNWSMSPLHPENNINGLSEIDYRKVHTFENDALLAYQIAYVRKIVRELNDFDNVIFEIQNEPWSDQGVVRLFANPNNQGGRDGWWTKIAVATDSSLAWQHTIAEVISETEAGLPKTHLIAQNYSNFKYPIAQVDSLISILNFHYAWPDAVHLNYGYNRVIGFDESGFTGHRDATYRKQAWRFMFAGGGIFNNLDYSFVAGYEDGTFEADSPGGGSPELRRQLSVLKELLSGLDLPSFQPARDLVVHAPGLIPQAMSGSNGSHVVYFERIDHGARQEVVLTVPEGIYRVYWKDPATGKVLGSLEVEHEGGHLRLVHPNFDEDTVVLLKRP